MRKETALDGLSKVVQADLVLQKQRLNDVLTGLNKETDDESAFGG